MSSTVINEPIFMSLTCQTTSYRCYTEPHEDLINSLESHTRIQMDGQTTKSSAQSTLHFFFLLLHKEIPQWACKWLSQNAVLWFTDIWCAVTLLNSCKMEWNFMKVTNSSSTAVNPMNRHTMIYSTSEHYINTYHLKWLNMNLSTSA
jgi:hypothetical protein